MQRNERCGALVLGAMLSLGMAMPVAGAQNNANAKSQRTISKAQNTLTQMQRLIDGIEARKRSRPTVPSATRPTRPNRVVRPTRPTRPARPNRPNAQPNPPKSAEIQAPEAKTDAIKRDAF